LSNIFKFSSILDQATEGEGDKARNWRGAKANKAEVVNDMASTAVQSQHRCRGTNS